MSFVQFELSCNFELLPHQFAAVRAAAGVDPSFPGEQSMPLQDAMVSAAAPRTAGLLLADVMGLGKTVEAVAAALLRIAIAKAQRKPARPTIIIAPNDAVMAQWREHLIKAGTPPSSVLLYKSKASRETQRWSLGGAHTGLRHPWVLLTRYTLLTEVRQALEGAWTHAGTKCSSPLFPHLTSQLASALHQVYKAAHGREKHQHKMPGETEADIVSRLVQTAFPSGGSLDVFRTLIIDEAHFLKNQASFWGIGAMLLAVHSDFSVPLTGTPYNNSHAGVSPTP